MLYEVITPFYQVFKVELFFHRIFQNDVLVFKLIGFVDVVNDVTQLFPRVGSFHNVVVSTIFHQLNSRIDTVLC